jgi:hypothetical protein
MKKQEMAFPSEALGQTGMTLRDWFAGMALQGLNAAPYVADWSEDDVIEMAWRQSEYMLKERNK